jgi:hypothetical protein
MRFAKIGCPQHGRRHGKTQYKREDRCPRTLGNSGPHFRSSRREVAFVLYYYHVRLQSKHFHLWWKCISVTGHLPDLPKAPSLHTAYATYARSSRDCIDDAQHAFYLINAFFCYQDPSACVPSHPPVEDCSGHIHSASGSLTNVTLHTVASPTASAAGYACHQSAHALSRPPSRRRTGSRDPTR